MTTPRRSADQFVNDFNGLASRISAIENQLKKPTGRAGALAPGFNAFGMPLGTVTGYASPVNVASFDGTPVPVTWTKVKSDFDITYTGERLAMPSDGLFMIFLGYREVWPRRTNRANNAGTIFAKIDGGNMDGAVLFMAAQATTVDPLVTGAGTGNLVGGLFLGYGNAVSLGVSATYSTEGLTGAILPTRIDVTAEVHRLIEG